MESLSRQPWKEDNSAYLCLLVSSSKKRLPRMNNKDVVFFNLFLAFIFQTVLDLPFREPSFSTLFTIYV